MLQNFHQSCHLKRILKLRAKIHTFGHGTYLPGNIKIILCNEPIDINSHRLFLMVPRFLFRFCFTLERTNPHINCLTLALTQSWLGVVLSIRIKINRVLCSYPKIRRNPHNLIIRLIILFFRHRIRRISQIKQTTSTLLPISCRPCRQQCKLLTSLNRIIPIQHLQKAVILSVHIGLSIRFHRWWTTDLKFVAQSLTLVFLIILQ